MTVLERWALASLAAATFAAAGAGAPEKGSEGDVEARRAYIVEMEPAAKKQLLEKKEQFSRLSAEKQDQLRQLHRDLEAQENREELERVMEEYFEWVQTLSASERSHLNSLTDPEERLRLVVQYRSSHGRWPGRRPEFGGYPPGRGVFEPRFLREFSDALKVWAGPYVASHVDALAALLPADEQEKWKSRLRQSQSEGPDGEGRLWLPLVSWYFAGPSQDLPINDADIASFETALPQGDLKTRYSESSRDTKIRQIQQGMRGMLLFLFGSGQSDLKDLVSAKELKEYAKSLPPDRQESLARLPEDMRMGQLRFSYFLSKLPAHMRSERDGFYPSRHGGPPRGEPRRDGSPDSRRGPGSGFWDRAGGAPDGMPSDGPGMGPPPGGMEPPPRDDRSDRRDMGPPPIPGSAMKPDSDQEGR